MPKNHAIVRVQNIAAHGSHGIRSASLALFLKIDFPARDRKDLVQAAVMHDIGKLLLPPHVFTKRGALSLKEETEYQSHSQKGADIVFFSDANMYPWILHHHERYDGKGYPRRLAGQAIPLGSRLLTLANRLDHLLARHEQDAGWTRRPKTFAKRRASVKKRSTSAAPPMLRYRELVWQRVFLNLSLRRRGVPLYVN